MGHGRLVSADHSKEWPSYLRTSKSAPNLDFTADAPIMINMRSKSAEQDLQALCRERTILEIVDSYDEQLAELFLSRDPHLYRANELVQKNSIEESLKRHYGKTPHWKLGTWAYFPWTGRLIHLIKKELFNDLRTIRNRDLITKEEQKKLAEFNIGCLGMSVGSSSALALDLSGMSHNIKLADGSVFSGSNLNRVLTGVTSIGQPKARAICRQLYEMNPYINVSHLDAKLSKDNIQEFLEKSWKLHLVIDEIDDLEMKILIRIEARKRRIPVLMATELADSVMLDVERFDLEPNRPLFHDMVKNVEQIVEKKDMTQREWTKHATAIIDPKNVPLNMQHSLLKIGTRVVTHPQLGATAMMTGGVLAFAAKQIALGKDMPSQRKSISLESTFQKEHRSFKHKRRHAKHTKVLKRALNAM